MLPLQVGHATGVADPKLFRALVDAYFYPEGSVHAKPSVEREWVMENEKGKKSSVAPVPILLVWKLSLERGLQRQHPSGNCSKRARNGRGR